MKAAPATLRRFLVPSAVCVSLLVPSLVLAAGGGPAPPLKDQLIWDFGLKAVNVAVLFFFLYKLLAKPFARYLDSRSEKILKELEEAQAGQKEAEERLRAFQEKVSRLDSELEELRQKTCTEIDNEQKLILEEARKAAEHIRQHNRDSIRQEVAKARDDLHREASRLAIELATDLISKNIVSQDHDRIITEYLKNMETAQ